MRLLFFSLCFLLFHSIFCKLMRSHCSYLSRRHCNKTPRSIVHGKIFSLVKIAQPTSPIQIKHHTPIKNDLAAQVRSQLFTKYGRGDWTQTSDLAVPNRARYQLRHTPIRFISHGRPFFAGAKYGRGDWI